QSKNAVDAAQAEVLNQYQRRADLVPNLVQVVKGAAAQEKETLEAVMNARAKATQMQVNLNDTESLQKFQRAQSELGSALSRLMVVSENYPQLKATESFRDLQVQLEGTENRITVARQRAIAAILEFNNQVTVFPTSVTNSFMFHYQPLPQWGADKDAKTLEQAPKVDFKK
ncbi:LemA family protein, partial [bacterium]|nr:LemA family protein [bacterium]